jgi:hypothetical protein
MRIRRRPICNDHKKLPSDLAVVRSAFITVVLTDARETPLRLAEVERKTPIESV